MRSLRQCWVRARLGWLKPRLGRAVSVFCDELLVVLDGRFVGVGLGGGFRRGW